MSRIEIVIERCKGCLLCVESCPKKIIAQSKNISTQGCKPAEFIEGGEDLCTGCTACAVTCPDSAIRVFRTKKRKSAV